MPLVTEARLRSLCQQILLAMQTPADIAEVVTDALVKADVKGVDSHGVRLLTMYLCHVEAGTIVPTARAEITRQDGAVTLIEGHWGFGQVPARQAARLAVDAAKQYGIGAASLVHVQHIGRVGEYAEEMAKHGMLGIAVCNTSRTTTPHGGMLRMFGTNPLAMAVPRGNGDLLVADFATSAKSVNKLLIARQREEPLPEGVILDKNGYPTTDPNDFFAGGYLLPVGGYKGYALNLFIDIIGGLLVGAGCAALITKHPGNGALFVALDIARWRPLNEFTADVDALLAAIKAAPAAPGVEEVLLPGELEARAEEQRLRKGIPLDEETWEELHIVAQKVGLPAGVFGK